MDRRTFLLAAASVAAVPPWSVKAAPITETYKECPFGFALRSWREGGISYRMVVPLPRYLEGSTCRWTEYANSNEAHKHEA